MIQKDAIEIMTRALANAAKESANGDVALARTTMDRWIEEATREHAVDIICAAAAADQMVNGTPGAKAPCGLYSK